MKEICISCTPDEFKELIGQKLLRHLSIEPEFAKDREYYDATCLVIRDIMSELKLRTYDDDKAIQQKELFYLSMEFLPGPSLKNNVFNLRVEDSLRQALAEMGKDLDTLFAMDPDAGLGNGGLGRLASCYMDAAATLGMAGHGMSICYEYGIFKQKIEEGKQIELPDDWLDLGDVWLVDKESETKEVRFGGKLEELWNEAGEMKLKHSEYERVLAVPRDLMITGYDSEVVNTLRLWKSTSPISIDMELFAKGEYLKSMQQKHRAEIISKILYPEDAHREGKVLRLSQQYFFISASMQSIVEKHINAFGTLDNFADKIAIHINDTHPTLAIPELLRIFIDEYNYKWEEAWPIVHNTVSYTNHTIMPEALEVWPESLFADLLPRIHSIVKEIDRRQKLEILQAFPMEDELRNQMAIIHFSNIRMANLCVFASKKVNGVSALHSEIIKKDLFSGYHRLEPKKFTNVTNGIAYRRWLCQANPELSSLIEEVCGPEFRKTGDALSALLAFREDSSVLERLSQVKQTNKIKLAEYIKKQNNIIVNPDSIFDVQVKRIHEYKRQLLNLLHIIHLYKRIKENPSVDIPSRTFLFAGKASAGYYMAKQVIRLAYHLSKVINDDPDIADRIKLVFLENYSVSLSELIMPAAEVSEQISLAGKEASGTGNMKLMVNGAVTIGTRDGANIEIHQAVGDDNIFIFGMGDQEAKALRDSGTYNPWSIYRSNSDISEVIGFLSEKLNNENFVELMNSLTTGFNGQADPYFVLADFDSYKRSQDLLGKAYQDRKRWNQMSLTNIASAGIFSADRSVKEYADAIWNIRPITGLSYE